MMHRLLFFLLFFVLCFECQAQHQRTYEWSWKKDGIILGTATAGWLGSQSFKLSADKATANTIVKLYSEDVWGFDRGAIGNSSENAKQLSDIFLMAGVTLPFLTYLDPKVRNEKGVVLGMGLEALLINDGITNIFKAATKRHRPYLYKASATEESISGNSRQSFISGHTSNVAAASFFAAQVLTDLHPDSELKPLIWTAAATIPAITGYLRFKAGRHFPTDIIAGYGVGALVGFLVPKWHRIKATEDVTIDMVPLNGGVGLSLTMNLH